MSTQLHSCIQIKAPARLHLGFLDLHGGLGRRFGSLGLTLDKPYTQITLSHAPELSVSGYGSQRVATYTQHFCKHLNLPTSLKIHLQQAIPEHVGLGSGTQLSLAVGVGIARYFELPLNVREIASLLERGARSGIGVAAFEQGGVILDGGRSNHDILPPPLIARLPFPTNWRILLIFDEQRQGVHGEQEVSAFRHLPPFPPERAAHLCRLILMQALPALALAELNRFGLAIAELQRVVGDHFAEAQGGRFTSPTVARILNYLEQQGVTGVGQSSWGPTGFAIVESQTQAEQLLNHLQKQFLPNNNALKFMICKGKNEGGSIQEENITTLNTCLSELQ
ncbi:GHMP kinase [Beggiatoa leptomitoformis]|uniref:GHMP kinase n=2 Tax=Beggiatoa leptomitoformis TaxID=288004 RepID=A0A2N9YIY8_9GAMM|nr:GHMP kinase [Beggiatoa leptomitoformis]AUI70498.1 GHMP kinase [Beggiatoa leptomitoformis]